MVRVSLFLSLYLLLVSVPGVHGQGTSTHDPRAGYAGDADCVACHTSQASTYVHTSHHLTSQEVTKESVLGSFAEGSNILMIVDPAHATAEPGLFFRMEEKNGSFYQSAVTGWGSQLQTRTERMDLMTGSGV